MFLNKNKKPLVKNQSYIKKNLKIFQNKKI